MSLTTARALIDSARTRHWAFTPLAGGDGAALLFLRARLATHVAQHGAAIEGLVGATLEYVVPLAPPAFLVTSSGALLATQIGEQVQVRSGTDVPAVATAYQDGWPVHLSEDHVPYVNFAEPSLAADPFGLYRGTPGFPLPGDLVRLIAVSLVYGQTIIPCDIVPEAQRHTTLPGRNPACFVATNRLVPVVSTASGISGTRWANVTSIQISYVAVQALRALDDVLNLPSVLTEALVADLAHFFAMQSPTVPVADKAGFARERDRCAGAIAGAALDLLNSPQQNAVLYRG